MRFILSSHFEDKHFPTCKLHCRRNHPRICIRRICSIQTSQTTTSRRRIYSITIPHIIVISCKLHPTKRSLSITQSFRSNKRIFKTFCPRERSNHTTRSSKRYCFRIFAHRIICTMHFHSNRIRSSIRQPCNFCNSCINSNRSPIISSIHRILYNVRINSRICIRERNLSNNTFLIFIKSNC